MGGLDVVRLVVIAVTRGLDSSGYLIESACKGDNVVLELLVLLRNRVYDSLQFVVPRSEDLECLWPSLLSLNSASYVNYGSCIGRDVGHDLDAGTKGDHRSLGSLF